MSQGVDSNFVSWLQKKVNANTDQEFEQIVNELGDDRINEYYDKYISSVKRSYRIGGIIEYVKCLQKNIAYRKSGGKMVSNCKCGGKTKSMMASGGIIKEGTDAGHKQEMIEPSRKHVNSNRMDSEKTKTKVVLPSKNKKMPNPNSKAMMAKGGKMGYESGGKMVSDGKPKLKVAKGMKEPDNKQMKGGIKERKYMK